MTQMITTEDAQYTFDIVQKICNEVGPGLPGSSQEWKRAAIIENELALHLGVKNVQTEEFTFAPGAFLSAYPINAFLMLIAALLNMSTGRLPGVPPLLSAIAGLAFTILSILPFIFEFVLGFELFDPLFKKSRSVNIIGRLLRPGTQQVRRLLILSGHHDSAPENVWLRFTGYGFFLLTATWMIGYLTLLVMGLLQLAGSISGSANLVRIGTL